MTPEQENELVARWMGWTKIAAHRATAEHWHPDTWGRPDCKAYYGDPPPYRTDPALLWELMERLIVCFWEPETLGDGYIMRVPGDSWDAGAKGATLAEAVFAAAVMQAEQEGK